MVSVFVLNQLHYLKKIPKNQWNDLFYLKHNTLDLGFKNFSDAVKHEAILNCITSEWCSLMCFLSLPPVLKSQLHSFYRDTRNLMCKQLSNQASLLCIQNTRQKIKLLCIIEPFDLFCLLETSQLNHFVSLLKIFKSSLESKGNQTMGAKRVYLSVPRMKNLLLLLLFFFYNVSWTNSSFKISSNCFRATCYCLCC